MRFLQPWKELQGTKHCYCNSQPACKATNQKNSKSVWECLDTPYSELNWIRDNGILHRILRVWECRKDKIKECLVIACTILKTIQLNYNGLTVWNTLHDGKFSKRVLGTNLRKVSHQESHENVNRTQLILNPADMKTWGEWFHDKCIHEDGVYTRHLRERYKEPAIIEKV